MKTTTLLFLLCLASNAFGQVVTNIDDQFGHKEKIRVAVLTDTNLNYFLSATNGKVIGTFTPKDATHAANAGDIPMWPSATNYMGRLAHGGDNTVLACIPGQGDIPSWVASSALPIARNVVINNPDLTTSTTHNAITPTADAIPLWLETYVDGTADLLECIQNVTGSSSFVFTIDYQGNVTRGTWAATKIGIAYGGTNAASFNTNGIIGYDGAALNSTVLTNGQLLIGWSGNQPVAAALTAGSNISITSGSGSITIAATGADSNALWLRKAPFTGSSNIAQAQSSGLPALTLKQNAATSTDDLLTWLRQDAGASKVIINSSGTVVTGAGGTGLTSYATGDLPYASATNVLSKLAATTDGYVLTLASGIPSWAAASSGMTNPMTTTGDIIYSSNNSGTPARLAIGASTSLLHGGVTPSYSKVSLTGDVVNTLPVSSGGTGATTLTTHGVVLSHATSALTAINAAAGTALSGQGTGSDPVFTTTLNLGNTGSTTGTLGLNTSGSIYGTSIRGSASVSGSSITLTLPPNTGNANEFLQTDGSGVLSWAAPGATTGGTGQTSWNSGDMLYASASNVTSLLAIGAAGKVLTVVGGFPAWSSTPAFTQIRSNGAIGSTTQDGTGITTSSASGSDVAGAITMTAATNLTGGTCTITFGTAYASAPIVVLTPANTTALVNVTSMYVTSTASTFTINFNATTIASGMVVNYHIIQ